MAGENHLWDCDALCIVGMSWVSCVFWLQLQDPSGSSDCFDIQTVLRELRSIRVAPHPCVKGKALGERYSGSIHYCQ